MAAGLGFKDFATGEVLTAADVDGYLMQGVWVFADAAARDAAVTSPQEGNFAYLKDTNVTTYYTGSVWANLDTTGMTNPMTTTGDTIYSSSGSTPARLGIGTAGQVLQVNSGATAPEWATPAGGGMTLLSTTTLSGATTTISAISGSYTDLQVVIYGAYVSANNQTFLVSLNADADEHDNSYIFNSDGSLSAGADYNVGNVGFYSIDDTSGAQALSGVLTIYNYASADPKNYVCSAWMRNDSASNNRANSSWGRYRGAAVSSILFDISGATTFSGGTVLVYGVK